VPVQSFVHFSAAIPPPLTTLKQKRVGASSSWLANVLTTLLRNSLDAELEICGGSF